MDKSKWLYLMKRLGFESNLSTFYKLESCYANKQRHYHSATHIAATLYHLDKSQFLAQDLSAIETALWFHDAVYNVLSSNNELNSAKWATEFLRKNLAQDEFINKVDRLIMVTRHNAEPSDNDERLIVDIDLSILGCPAELYTKYEEWIRTEYRLVPSFIYKKKRKRVLKSFLARERIYSQDYFYDKFEIQARKNINDAIDAL